MKLGDNMTNFDGRMTTTADGLEAVIVGHGDALGKDHPFSADLCAVAFSGPQDVDSLKAAAAAFAQVDPDPSLGGTGKLGFVWRAGAKGHERIPAAELVSNVTDPTTSALMVQSSASLTLLAFAAPTK